MWGLGFWVSGLGFRDFGLGAWDRRFAIQGLGFGGLSLQGIWGLDYFVGMCANLDLPSIHKNSLHSQ